MNKILKYLIYILVIFIIVSFGTWYFNYKTTNAELRLEKEKELLKRDRVEKIKIESGSTYGELMVNAGLTRQTANYIYNSAEGVYDLAKIKVGNYLELIYDKDTDEFKKFVYKIDSEDELTVRIIKIEDKEHSGSMVDINEQTSIISDPAIIVLTIEEPEWHAEISPIQYEIKVKTSGGKIVSSLYQAALDDEIDERVIIELANVFQWTMDFAMDTRVGDEFQFIHEERYLDGEYIRPGKILAAKYINSGTVLDHYYFEESEDNKGYFDGDGNSVQKMFLKAPVEFRYISSGYTTGNRVVMEIGLSGPHRAIDYAAPLGTPIRSVGDGVVVFAGWSSVGYGNLTRIRHNGTYSTNYAHQSKFAVRSGTRVKQGDIIGYVGNTGYSTGPHLHYEMVKDGVKIDPLREVLPPGKAIKDENKDRFFEEISDYSNQLGIK